MAISSATACSGICSLLAVVPLPICSWSLIISPGGPPWPKASMSFTGEGHRQVCPCSLTLLALPSSLLQKPGLAWSSKWFWWPPSCNASSASEHGYCSRLYEGRNRLNPAARFTPDIPDQQPQQPPTIPLVIGGCATLPVCATSFQHPALHALPSPHGASSPRSLDRRFLPMFSSFYRRLLSADRATPPFPPTPSSSSARMPGSSLRTSPDATSPCWHNTHRQHPAFHKYSQ